MSNGKLSSEEFAQRLRTKYPQYANLPTNVLVERVLAKYPQYNQVVDLTRAMQRRDPSALRTLGEAAFQAPGRPIPEMLRSRISGWAGMHLPPSVAPGVAQALDIPAQIVAAPLEVGRQSLSPVGLATIGFGTAIGPLVRVGAPLWSRVLGWGLAAGPMLGFGVSGAKQALEPIKEGESGADYLGRVLGGTGQALLSATALPGVRKALPAQESIAETHPRVIRELAGSGIQANFDAANRAMAQEVSRHAEALEKTIDDPARNPIPAIDAAPYADKIKELWGRYVKTSQPIGIRPPKAFMQIFEEAQTKRRWTWGETKQVRTALGEIAADTTDARVRAIANGLRPEITADLRSQARKVGLGDSFEHYNELHAKAEDLRQQLINPILKAGSGEKVLNVLHRNMGYAQTRLPALDVYGLKSGPIIDAAKIPEGGGYRLWSEWGKRHLVGSAARAMGLPFAAGYLFAGYLPPHLESSIEHAGRLQESPFFRTGAQRVAKSLPPKPQAVREPSPIPPPPSESMAPRRPPPALPVPPGTEALPEPARPAAEAAPPKPLTPERELYTLNRSISKLTRGSPRDFTEAEKSYVLDKTGVDISERANWPEARSKLIELRDGFIGRRVSRARKQTPMPPPPSTPPTEAEKLRDLMLPPPTGKETP